MTIPPYATYASEIKSQEIARNLQSVCVFRREVNFGSMYCNNTPRSLNWLCSLFKAQLLLFNKVPETTLVHLYLINMVACNEKIFCIKTDLIRFRARLNFPTYRTRDILRILKKKVLPIWDIGYNYLPLNNVPSFS